MALTYDVQTLEDGPRNLVVKIHYDADASAASSAASQTVVDVSTLSTRQDGSPCTEVKLMRVTSGFVGATGELYWDASAATHAWEIPDYDHDANFEDFGGIINNASAATGDVTITFTGLTAGDTGQAILYFVKKYA